ncbi:hypothetical protein L5515_005645 [Caenorhabditis briggsae]|uniref:Uncharacterized protein n=1 Tax=Caenorhabditis briggsae TaxID=6238 RepID=A0AAE9JFA2_CAEBR|nr:hypothetical protein L5515_005645 [Caenorhabditis briggsae]
MNSSFNQSWQREKQEKAEFLYLQETENTRYFTEDQLLESGAQIEVLKSANLDNNIAGDEYQMQNLIKKSYKGQNMGEYISSQSQNSATQNDLFQYADCQNPSRNSQFSKTRNLQTPFSEAETMEMPLSKYFPTSWLQEVKPNRVGEKGTYGTFKFAKNLKLRGAGQTSSELTSTLALGAPYRLLPLDTVKPISYNKFPVKILTRCSPRQPVKTEEKWKAPRFQSFSNFKNYYVHAQASEVQLVQRLKKFKIRSIKRSNETATFKRPEEVFQTPVHFSPESMTSSEFYIGPNAQRLELPMPPMEPHFQYVDFSAAQMTRMIPVHNQLF